MIERNIDVDKKELKEIVIILFILIGTFLVTTTIISYGVISFAELTNINIGYISWLYGSLTIITSIIDIASVLALVVSAFLFGTALIDLSIRYTHEKI